MKVVCLACAYPASRHLNKRELYKCCNGMQWMCTPGLTECSLETSCSNILTFANFLCPSSAVPGPCSCLLFISKVVLNLDQDAAPALLLANKHTLAQCSAQQQYSWNSNTWTAIRPGRASHPHSSLRPRPTSSSAAPHSSNSNSNSNTRDSINSNTTHTSSKTQMTATRTNLQARLASRKLQRGTEMLYPAPNVDG